MNALYNLIAGNRKNASKFYVTGEAVEAGRDELDENGFVMVNSENFRQQARIVQNEDLQSHALQQPCGTDSNYCLLGDTTSSCQSSCLSTPCISAVADIPMQTSVLLTTIESYRTLSINHRKYLDLELFNYDFQIELSVLNDMEVSNEKRKS